MQPAGAPVRGVVVTVRQVGSECWDWQVDWVSERFNTRQRSSGTSESWTRALENVTTELAHLSENPPGEGRRLRSVLRLLPVKSMGVLMGRDGKYGTVTTEHGDIPGDEPVIVFRARDRLTPPLLSHYYEMCKATGSPPRHLEMIQGAYKQFVQWQEEHPDEVRQPDSERSRAWMET